MSSNGTLDVLIIGAGIGGLTAAIGLRQQGHRVTIFEQSRLASETGAAIHIAPNCNGVLRRLGLYVEDVGANVMVGFDEYTPQGRLKHSINVDGPAAEMWQHPWHLVHRVHLHQALKRMATDSTGKGMPAQLYTSSRVVDVDCNVGFVALQNGEKFHGDVVVGADGVHSTTRKHISGGKFIPFGSGKSAFRFLIPRKTLQNDSATAAYVEKEGRLTMWVGEDRRLVMYPCANNELMNLLVIHPSRESEASGDEWNQGGNKDRLLEVCKDFGPGERAILSHADLENLKVWQLLDMDVLPTWINNRLVLLGDAAHPFLPHQGQGGAQAIEDSAALAVVLPFGTPKEEIPERLKLYEKCRQQRANKIQQYTRLAGRDLGDIANDGFQLNMMEYTAYNFGHDEWDHSNQMLRKWLWARSPNLYWRMPVGFGPAPGPRQDIFGRPRNGADSAFRTASIKFKTSRTMLQNLFPSPSFSFASPATVAHATFSTTTLDKMEWLGGSGYNHCGLYIHGVRYTKKDGSILHGTFLAVLFENLTDPITTGREELGMPKLYCAIDIDQEADSLQIQLHWRGARFGTLKWHGLEASETAESSTTNGETTSTKNKSAPLPKDEGILAYRYIPAVGERGKADAEYTVFVPDAKRSVEAVNHTELLAKDTSILFEGRDWSSLPTLHHVSSVLAEIPVYGVIEGKVVTGQGVEDVSQAERIE